MQAHGLSLRGSGLAGALPNLAMVVAGLAAGWMADALVARGVAVTRVRKLVLVAGFAGAIAFFLPLPRPAASAGAPACLSGGPARFALGPTMGGVTRLHRGPPPP